ncbi:alpha/beta fold hydrolase [Streptacidiphilus sp. N1-10]|uniref:Alpha/beta fold hydrolase n=1 Tax=Streptacidiphilus jeojiensis TaxID=3229225 RepID=A0ABV6XRR1_9ACTN
MTTFDFFELGDFSLAGGATVPDAKLAYRTLGTLNAAKDNAILFPTFLAAPPEALDVWIGEGRPLDPTKYFIILPGHFGLSPSTSPENTAAPFERGAFPAVHISDDVIAQHRLVTEKFGISELQLILGWSVGSLQIWEWAVRFAPMVKRLASIAGSPRPRPWTKLWLRYAVEEQITSDPAWQGGFYPSIESVQAGLRRVGRVTAITAPTTGFYREGEELWRPLGFSSDGDVVSRLFEGLFIGQDPNGVIAQARKAALADPAHGGELADALGGITAKTLVAGFTGDFLFPPEESRRAAALVPGAKYQEIPSSYGHLATFALSEQDVKNVDQLLRDLLSD